MPDLSIESRHTGIIAGVDEVGRGCIAGPVIAAAVILPQPLPEPLWQLDDSKKLSLRKREQLFEVLQKQAVCSVGQCSVEEIQEWNILQASLKAMQRAVHGLSIQPEIALIDGNKAPALDCKTETVVKGDSKSLSIAAASVIAKVTRDRMMETLSQDFPYYDWHKNKGYPSLFHKKMLLEYGLTKHHRLSFAPCKNLLEKAA